MTKAYKLSIIYYFIFSLLLLLSGYLLFEHKIGFGYDNVVGYYLGDEEKFIPSKSHIGTLKLILPHVFVFGLFVMVLAHFLVFTKLRYEKSTLYLIYALFASAALELFSPFLIIAGLKFFAYVKLLAFFGFLVLLLYLIWLLFKSIAFE